MPLGTAVDAACGTGRHTEYLAARGHRVLGFDTSPRMLAVARPKVPDAAFARADLRSLPLPASSVDLVVCTAALAHLEELGPVFQEFARVLRPGGHLVVSDTRGYFIGSGLYPLVKQGMDGSFGYIPTWRHQTSDYLRAALPHGFLVRHCEEPLRSDSVIDLDDEPPTAEVPDPDAPPDVWSLHGWAAEAAHAAYRDDPAVIIWHFELHAEGTR